MADTTQSPTPEAVWLRENWNPNVLGIYDQKWIAVKDDHVISSGTNLDSLLSGTIKQNPLYAFIYFGPLQ